MTYYTDLIRRRRRAPADDLTSALIDSAELDDSEIITILFLLGVAGNETTTKLIGNAWYWAWLSPDQRKKAFSGRISAWIEETLRYDGAGQVVLRRVVADVEFHGVTIPAGGRLLLLEASANRDADVFPDPDLFDLDRDTSRLLSFGNGIHFCLGAALARLTAEVALEEMTNAVEEGYEMDPQGIRRAHSANTRGFSVLPTLAKPRRR
jgi:cytochrome P450